MELLTVPAATRLHVTYSFHEAPEPVNDRVIVMHHGICHTRDQFLPLILRLNGLGFHVAMIDQQSENAGFWRNGIGAKQYREGMAAAVRMIQEQTKLEIGCYALHSMGALIGEEMQQRYPDLRQPTVLMAPIPVNGALPITLRILWRHPISYLKAVLTLDIHSLVQTPEQVRELFFDRCTPDSIVEETTRELKHAPFWMYCQLVLRRLVRPRIRDNDRPKMLLHTTTDEIFHPSEYNHTRISERTKWAEGGHDFFIEYAERTAKRIADFSLQNCPQPVVETALSGFQGEKSVEGEPSIAKK